MESSGAKEKEQYDAAPRVGVYCVHVAPASVERQSASGRPVQENMTLGSVGEMAIPLVSVATPGSDIRSQALDESRCGALRCIVAVGVSAPALADDPQPAPASVMTSSTTNATPRQSGQREPVG